MKSISRKLLLLTLFVGMSFYTNAQGFEPGAGMTQLNFGIGVSGWGVPVYLGMDFGIADKVTIGPQISHRTYKENYGWFGNAYKVRYSITNLSFRGDYHYGGHIDALPSELDLYGGLSLGYTIWTDNYDGSDNLDLRSSGVYLGIQAGARWYFHPNWAANAEVSGSSLSGLTVGLSYKF